MLHIPGLRQVPVVYRDSVPLRYLFPIVLQAPMNIPIHCSLYYYREQTTYPYAICPLYSTGKDTQTVYFYLMP